ncbi:MAG: hypothetical protein WAP51_01850 [Candidatus Sungiibacteriota bacterium]
MRNRIGGVALLFTAVIALQACATAASFQGPIPAPKQVVAYPEKGQSPEQTAKDTSECNQWAFKATGEKKPGEEGVKAGSESAVIEGLFGAATGALFGHFITGNPGAWAGYDGSTGALWGGKRGFEDASRTAQGKYERAYALCMRARGYAVTD